MGRSAPAGPSRVCAQASVYPGHQAARQAGAGGAQHPGNDQDGREESESGIRGSSSSGGEDAPGDGVSPEVPQVLLYRQTADEDPQDLLAVSAVQHYLPKIYF